MIELETLPKGWTIAKFEDLLDYIQPTNYIVKSTDYKDTYPTPVLTAGKSFIKGYTNETEGIFTKLPTIIFDDFTTATQFVNFPFKVKSSAMKILQPTCDLVNIKLAYYYMQTIHLKGETHKRFWISEYSKIPVALAPLNEQKRILAKLEQLLTDLDKGIEYLETTKKQLKVYRQAVLKWAFEGENNSYRIEDLCKAIFAGGDMPKRHFSAQKTEELQVPVYANAIPNNGLLGFTKEASVFDKAITIAARGSGTGHVELRETPFLPIVRLITVIPNTEIVQIKYLFYFLKSISIKGGGSAIPQLTIPMLKQYKVHLPSLNKQKEIISEIESRLSVCDKIEETIESTLQQAEALRLSIIKKAFEGKLVPQDPNDEPAEKLLERIKAAKWAGKPEKKEKGKAEKKVKTKKVAV